MNVVSPELIVALAGGAQILGYLVINQVALRLLLLLGTVLYVWYYLVVADTPLWEAIYLSVLMGVANLIGLGGLYLRRSRFSVPGAHRDIFPRFPDLSPGDFRALMKHGTRRAVYDREQLTQQGQKPQTLTYVLSGGLDVNKDGDNFRMPADVFVGEVAYMQDRPSAASIWVRPMSEILQWEVSTLRRQSARQSRFGLALQSVISRDLAAKVSMAVAPHDGAWRDGDQRSSEPASATAASPSSSIR